MACEHTACVITSTSAGDEGRVVRLSHSQSCEWIWRKFCMWLMPDHFWLCGFVMIHGQINSILLIKFSFFLISRNWNKFKDPEMDPDENQLLFFFLNEWRNLCILFPMDKFQADPRVTSSFVHFCRLWIFHTKLISALTLTLYDYKVNDTWKSVKWKHEISHSSIGEAHGARFDMKISAVWNWGWNSWSFFLRCCFPPAAVPLGRGKVKSLSSSLSPRGPLHLINSALLPSLEHVRC